MHPRSAVGLLCMVSLLLSGCNAPMGRDATSSQTSVTQLSPATTATRPAPRHRSTRCERVDLAFSETDSLHLPVTLVAV
jgi:hypothetical protein